MGVLLRSLLEMAVLPGLLSVHRDWQQGGWAQHACLPSRSRCLSVFEGPHSPLVFRGIDYAVFLAVRLH